MRCGPHPLCECRCVRRLVVVPGWEGLRRPRIMQCAWGVGRGPSSGPERVQLGRGAWLFSWGARACCVSACCCWPEPGALEMLRPEPIILFGEVHVLFWCV